MTEVKTRHFGAIGCDESAILLFPDGLPAFEQAKRFVLIERPATSPAVFLQSVDDAGLCFAALPLLAVDPEYQLAIAQEDLRTVGLDETRQPSIGTEAGCFAILTAPEGGPVTANLMAPVVVNLSTRRCVQAIRLDSAYSHRKPLTGSGSTPCS